MLDTFLFEWEKRNRDIYQLMKEKMITALDFNQAAIAQLELLKKMDPQDVSYVSQQGELYHLDGYLRKAGELYRKVLEMDPLLPLTDKEERFIQKFCPILMVTPKECFPLKDIVAIHHPSKPIIGYHLFWEDDYDFPDDYEPCDHEEVWIEYDPEAEVVKNVMCWFHARVLDSELAVKEAHHHQQRAIIRIEWGKHGSLLCGWENMKEPLTGVSLPQWLKETYDHVKSGGRVPSHPLKKFWPKRFDGSIEEYTNFSVEVDPLDLLKKKPLMFKSEWVNAVIFTNALLYNFHPKMEWPERFFRSMG
ncbi:tetratricopeptide repeat protein [Neobacillus sp. SM06]|uniref:tetratricopeptide repeat protein n=1 Tax=Neobacillus sp. SM06 TaxID=3422492 RepID=UPI003D266596